MIYRINVRVIFIGKDRRFRNQMNFYLFLLSIGRSGAFGRKGMAINFITNEDRQTLRNIEQYYNTKIEELPRGVPMGG